MLGLQNAHCPEESPWGLELVPSLFESRQRDREVFLGMGGECSRHTTGKFGELDSFGVRLLALLAQLLLFNNFHVSLLVLAPGSRALPQELP